jgi:hypothetical protein
MGTLFLDVVNPVINYTRAAPFDCPAVGSAVERSSASDVYVGCAVFSGCCASNLKGLVNDATRRLVEAVFRLVKLVPARSMRCCIDCRGVSREEAIGRVPRSPLACRFQSLAHRTALCRHAESDLAARAKLKPHSGEALLARARGLGLLASLPVRHFPRVGCHITDDAVDISSTWVETMDPCLFHRRAQSTPQRVCRSRSPPQNSLFDSS